MIKVLFGRPGDGRVGRLTYLGYTVLLAVIVIFIGISIAFAIGIGEQLTQHITGGDLQQTQTLLRQHLSLPLVITLLVLGVALLYAKANLIAKRVRDIGLPGWLVMIALVILSGVLSYYISQNASNALSSIVFIALVLIPGGLLARD